MSSHMLFDCKCHNINEFDTIQNYLKQLHCDSTLRFKLRSHQSAHNVCKQMLVEWKCKYKYNLYLEYLRTINRAGQFLLDGYNKFCDIASYTKCFSRNFFTTSFINQNKVSERFHNFSDSWIHSNSAFSTKRLCYYEKEITVGKKILNHSENELENNFVNSCIGISKLCWPNRCWHLLCGWIKSEFWVNLIYF